jgi:hypothetical protein
MSDHLLPMVDQLLDLDLPLLERKCPEPVLLEECPDLVIAVLDAESGDAGRGESKTISGDQKPPLMTASTTT